MSVVFKAKDPIDYSDQKIKVYFEVASKDLTEEVFINTDFVEVIKEKPFGFIINIARQEIPEVLSLLHINNIAVYAVVPGIDS